MSRELKVTSIGQADRYINDLNDQMKGLKSRVERVNGEAKEEARRIVEQSTKSLQTDMTAMENNLNAQINGMESDMAEMDRSHRRLLKEQSKKFADSLSGLKDWTSDTIGNLEDQVNKSFSQQQEQLDEQKRRLNYLYQKETDEQKKAQLMVKDLKILAAAVDKRSLHAKFAPGKLAQLQRRIDALQESGLPSAAIMALAVNITNDIWELEEDILKSQLMFNAVYNLALQEAIEILRIMSKNRNELSFTDKEGNNLKDENGIDIKVEIDFWTQGGYGELEGRLEAQKRYLEENKNSPELTEEKVNQVLTEISEIRLEQDQLIRLAVERGLASEERLKISEDIINAMLMQGFSLQQSSDDVPAHNYLGGETEADLREGVFALLKNGAGTEISIIVHPDETLTKNHIIFQRNDDASRSADELRYSVGEVKSIIEQEGYIMGDLASPAGTGDNKQLPLAMAEELSKNGISRELKKQLGFIR